MLGLLTVDDEDDDADTAATDDDGGRGVSSSGKRTDCPHSSFLNSGGSGGSGFTRSEETG